MGEREHTYHRSHCSHSIGNCQPATGNAYVLTTLTVGRAACSQRNSRVRGAE